MTRLEKIASLYKAVMGTTPSAEQLNTYAGLNEDIALEVINATMMGDSPIASGYESLTTELLVQSFFNTIFDIEVDTASDGFAYWVNEVENNPFIDASNLAIALINGADEAGQAALATDVASIVTAYEAAYPDGGTETPTEQDGETQYLTVANDVLVGTADKDTFIADINQVAYTGSVANTLATGDRIDGGASTDTLKAQITTQQVTSDNGVVTDVQPRTTSVEIVEIEAQDFSDGNGYAVLDAKNMTGITKIGSSYSDGDLVIENLTTLTDAGVIRNTADMTITMDHTDNFNSDEDASDLTVYFDEDYLVSGQETSGSELLIRMLNAVSNVEGGNPIDGTTSLSFFVGTTEVVVDLSAIESDATLDFTSAYGDVVDAINAQLAAQGLDTVTASLAPIAEGVFSIPVSVYDSGDSAGYYYPILVTNSGSEELVEGTFTTTAVEYDTDQNNSMNADPAQTADVPLSVNIELTKVGRDADGGDLIVGGKSQDALAPDTDVDQTDGIDQFNITVFGNEDLPSNLGIIRSTNGALDTVIIDSESRTDNSYAALTVRDAFGGTLETLNANAFMGNLSIGSVTAAADIDTFTATGGGNVYLRETISFGTQLPSSLDEDNSFTVTTGTGVDTILIDANGGAQVDINTGSNDDSISVSIDGQDTSGSDLTKAFITSLSGNNTVSTTSVDAIHEALINLGSGSDTVNGNTVNIEVDTGSGKDTIYASNTAQKAIFVQTAGTSAADLGVQAVDDGGVRTYNINETELLFGRTVTVTLATQGLVDALNLDSGFEATATIVASNGYLTTELDLYKAIMNAINNDDVLSKLAVASIDSNGNLSVGYLVDGAIVNLDDAVEYTISDAAFTTLTASEEAGILADIQEKFADSDITAASVEAAYDAITTIGVIEDAVQAGVMSASTDTNIVNGGLDNDVIVLNSYDGLVDTGVVGVNANIETVSTGDIVVFDTTSIGNDTIVNFTATVAYDHDGDTGTADLVAANDQLDFTAWLDNQYTLSGSTVSRNSIDTDLEADLVSFSANSVVVADSADIETAYGNTTSTVSFDTLTDSQILAALNGTSGNANAVAGTFAVDAYAGTGTLVGTTQKSILMIENLANDGEYLVVEVTANNVTGDAQFTDASIIGSVDFGDTVGFVDGNFVL